MSGGNSELCRCVVDCQRTLYAYILKLLPDANDAKDVLQETNVILLGKTGEEFSQVENFGGWAARIAFYQVMAFRSRKRRERILYDDDLVKLLAEETAAEVTPDDPKLRHLGRCLGRLVQRDRELLNLRYSRDRSITAIAEQVGRTARATSQALYRIRSALMKCIDRAMWLEKGREFQDGNG